MSCLTLVIGLHVEVGDCRGQHGSGLGLGARKGWSFQISHLRVGRGRRFGFLWGQDARNSIRRSSSTGRGLFHHDTLIQGLESLGCEGRSVV